MGRWATVFGTGIEVPLAGSSTGFGRVALVLCLLVMFVGCDRRKAARLAVLMANTAISRRGCYCWSIVDGRWEMGLLKYEKKSLGKRNIQASQGLVGCGCG
jgi:hypothetical protein